MRYHKNKRGREIIQHNVCLSFYTTRSPALRQGLGQEGAWPDLDMIPFGELCILARKGIKKKKPNADEAAFAGSLHHWYNFTEPEKETFLTQRSISASPSWWEAHLFRWISIQCAFSPIKSSNEVKKVQLSKKFAKILVGKNQYQMRDIWGQKDYKVSKKSPGPEFTIQPHGVLYLRYNKI
ncbi:MAG: hypothetical protein HQL32_04440 [Planctomycetes bacterium]|nr:hypothetical protein [Planctomycetota bacterium]